MTECEYPLKYQIELIKHAPILIKDIPIKYLKIETCLKAVKRDGLIIEYIPESMQTKEVCAAAIKQNSKAILHISKNLINEELYIQAVKRNAGILEYIPIEHLTEKICIEAIKRNKKAIRKIPKKIITEKMCVYAFLSNYLLKDKKYVMKRIDKIKNTKSDFDNTIFVPHKYNSIAKKLFNEEEYEIINVSIYSFEDLKNFLVGNKESKNHFIFDDKMPINLLTEIAASNSELIILYKNNIPYIYEKLANRTIKMED